MLLKTYIKQILYLLLLAVVIYSCSISAQKKSNIDHSNIFDNQEKFVRIKLFDTADKNLVVFKNNWQVEFKNNLIHFSPNDSISLSLENNLINLFAHNSKLNFKANSFKISSIEKNGELLLTDVPYGVGWWWEGRENRAYEGEFEILLNMDNKIEFIVELPLEDYLCGVVPYEIGNDAPLEALKAQAIAARSEAVMALLSKSYAGENYDLTSDVECQVYGGNNKRNELTDQAIAETRGMVLFENEKPIHAFYASSCGGSSETISNVWPEREKYLSYQNAFADNEKEHESLLFDENNAQEWIINNPDVYCNPKFNQALPGFSKQNFRWQRKFDSEEIESLIDNKELGKFLNFVPERRGFSGRITVLNLIFEKGSYLVEGELNIRRLWNPPLRSSAFFIKNQDNGLYIYGAGWGHGVGMCQSGAWAMAQDGKSFQDILKHYYKKADLTIIY